MGSLVQRRPPPRLRAGPPESSPKHRLTTDPANFILCILSITGFLLLAVGCVFEPPHRELVFT